jgi:glycosyltransferase involved in cell wall biosynthesis
LIEAMVAQKAVLYLDTPENRETAADGGLPFRADSGSLASGMTRLLQDAELREDFGRKAQERATRLFGWGETTQKYESLFSEVVGKNGDASSSK